MVNKFKVSDGLMYAFILIISLMCVLPMVLVLVTSLTPEALITRYGYTLIPRQLTLYAYQNIMRNSATLVRSYFVTVSITVIGTTLAVLITACAAYALANKNVQYRNAMALYFFFTMIFSAGLVPWFIICTRLGLRNNFAALIVPSLMFSVFELFLVRNFMNKLPSSLMEAAKIDGAGDATIAFRIYFPLCLPVLAAISLFYALGYWNSWFNAIMLVENRNLFPLQYFLFRIQSDMNMMAELMDAAHVGAPLPTESVKMATVMITIGPIVLLYPFLQRYFVKGLVMGAVKG